VATLAGLFVVISAAVGEGLPSARAEAPAEAVNVFNHYVAKAEARLAKQHRAQDSFLSPEDSVGQARLQRGWLITENLMPPGADDPPGAMLHHWRGTAFVAGATVDDLVRLLKTFEGYLQWFAPEVLRAKILTQYSGAIPDRFTASMRVSQKHVITVVMDTTYDVSFYRPDHRHGYSVSRSTRIDEISLAGTTKERVLLPEEEHGYLWRMNTYWSYEERDGGLYMQIESISLTRGIPTGLGWAVRPYVESVPRESLEFTLRAACRALQHIRHEREG